MKRRLVVNNKKNQPSHEDLLRPFLAPAPRTNDAVGAGISRREFLGFATASILLAHANQQSPQPESRNGIPYRTLGRTREKVSLVGLGGYHLGKQADPQESIRIIRTGLDEGVDFLDNCWDYKGGESEIRMGNALRDGYRQKAFLMSKIDGRTKAAAASQINESLRRLQTERIDLLQFHGDEQAHFCAAFGRPYVKAVPVRPGIDLLQYAARYADARALLLDAFQPGGLPGGTGTTFDWNQLPSHLPRPVILSGGLTPQNVATAIRAVRPWAVDVSSGVEVSGDDGRPEKGIKSAAKIAAFIHEVRNAAD